MGINVEQEGFGETFALSRYTDGQVTVEEFKENGKDICVTEANKCEYIMLRYVHPRFKASSTHWMAYTSIMPQMEAIKAGFYSVVDRKLFVNITADDLEELICGKSIIILSDWMQNTVYKEPYSAGDQVIKWFWMVLGTYTQEQLSRLVQFTTGTSRIPAGGFSVLESNRGEYSKFCIQAVSCDSQEAAYPQAHTCFNRLTLPMYPSYEALKEKMDFIVNNEILGFGID